MNGIPSEQGDRGAMPTFGHIAPIVPGSNSVYRESMPRNSLLLLLILVGPLLTAACSLPAPYVFKPDEFNREAPGFGAKAKDIAEVAICYNASSTTPKGIRDMAQTTCAKFDKQAVYKLQDYRECPILTPRRAVFTCVKP